MLGPDVNESYQKKYDKMMAGPNKFKPGDIITDFNHTPSESRRHAKISKRSNNE